MTDQEILSRIDHTLLKADASWEEIKALCNEAVRYKTATVCIPPSYVSSVFGEYGRTLVICTVAGFPLGYTYPDVKAHEAGWALADGAEEIDMMINIGDIKNDRFDNVLNEIKNIKKICGERILKVIVETCCLNEAEKIRMCGIVTESGADFIKTSTGFAASGAALADVRLFKQHLGSEVRIKAAGGIKTREDMVAFIEAGADRIGASSAVRLLTGGVVA